MGPIMFVYLEDGVPTIGHVVGFKQTPTEKKYYLKFRGWSDWMTKQEIEESDWIGEIVFKDSSLIQVIKGGVK